MMCRFLQLEGRERGRGRDKDDRTTRRRDDEKSPPVAEGGEGDDPVVLSSRRPVVLNRADMRLRGGHFAASQTTPKNSLRPSGAVARTTASPGLFAVKTPSGEMSPTSLK